MNHHLINQSSQSTRTKYFALCLLSLVTLKKVSKIEEAKKETKAQWKEEKRYTRI